MIDSSSLNDVLTQAFGIDKYADQLRRNEKASQWRIIWKHHGEALIKIQCRWKYRNPKCEDWKIGACTQ